MKKLTHKYITDPYIPEGVVYYFNEDNFIWQEPVYQFGLIRRLLDRFFGWHFYAWTKKECLICGKEV